MRSYKYQTPPMSIFGYESIKMLGDELKQREYKKALIVTDKGICDIGVADKLTKVLEGIELEYVLYNKVKPNPTTNVITSYSIHYTKLDDLLRH